VDTGGWLHHKYFMVAADRIRPYAKHEDHFYTDLSKKQIEQLPPYDEKAVGSEEKWRDYENEYRRAWTSAGSVGHQAGSDHNVTPTADEMASSGEQPSGNVSAAGTPGYVPDLTPQRIRSIHEPPQGPGVNLHPQEQTATSAAVNPISSQSNSSMSASTLIGDKGPGAIRTDRPSGSSSGGSRRLDAFQNSVRSNLPDLQRGCTICGCAPASESRTALGQERKKAS
jgi:hypothetical protein